MEWWALMTGAVVVTSFLIASLALRQSLDVGRESRERICLSINQQRDVNRLIIKLARDETLSTIIDPEQRRRAVRFYGRIIALVQNLECEEIVVP
jgi:hypothetical protein